MIARIVWRNPTMKYKGIPADDLCLVIYQNVELLDIVLFMVHRSLLGRHYLATRYGSNALARRRAGFQASGTDISFAEVCFICQASKAMQVQGDAEIPLACKGRS